ncbi:sigma-54 interaction domain-containing protein [Pollutibacter soli]|uniref:sigma-54 interaction domain-containing protein n=1 Tax=Pollutibacter soli TaxID=3034157 RepID=UPI00301340C3
MQEFQHVFGLITAGILLLSGMINLFAGLYSRGQKAELVFGMLSLCGFIFIVLPPVGFIVQDVAPYSDVIKFKRIFIWSYYALLPWFLEYYSGYKNRKITWVIAALLAISYGIMFMESDDLTLWFYISRVALGLILLQGILSAEKQRMSGRINESRWLSAAMVIYGVVWILSIIDKINHDIYGTWVTKIPFLTSHLHMISFTVIMSIRLTANLLEKNRLEKVLSWRDSRWNLLVKNMELLVVELDRSGIVKYANPYAIQKLGFTGNTSMINEDWFAIFPTNIPAEQARKYYQTLITDESTPVSSTSHENIRSADHQLLSINWTNVIVYNADKSEKVMMKIGVDNTAQIKYFEEIELLKNQLEKENLLLKAEISPDQTESDLIGTSDQLLQSIQKSKQVAATNAGVLLLGETGSGKELFAELIHRNSFRNQHPMIRVNCAALPSDLIESELFGHEKGAFTGASSSRKGKFELADGSTIFLDEIGELPLSLQAKLLRVLQFGEFERIGGSQVVKVDVRVIAATNRNLQQEVKSGKFRDDLYYRLSVFPISIPPLRNRPGDIPLLIAHFVRKYATEMNKDVFEVSKADLLRLSGYSWPGNIRELRNLIERSVILSTGKTLQLAWLNDGSEPATIDSEMISMENVERRHILKVLSECNGRINGKDGAAERLGLNPSTLRSRLKKLQIDRV